MNHPRQEPCPRSRARLWWIVAGISAAIVIAAVIGVLAVKDSGVSSLSDDDAAQQRCEVDVVNRLASPATAQIAEIDAKSDVLDTDSRDLFSLLEPPLRESINRASKSGMLPELCFQRTTTGARCRRPSPAAPTSSTATWCTPLSSWITTIDSIGPAPQPTPERWRLAVLLTTKIPRTPRTLVRADRQARRSLRVRSESRGSRRKLIVTVSYSKS